MTNKKGELGEYILFAIIAAVILFILFSFLFKINIIELFKNIIIRGK